MLWRFEVSQVLLKFEIHEMRLGALAICDLTLARWSQVLWRLENHELRLGAVEI